MSGVMCWGYREAEPSVSKAHTIFPYFATGHAMVLIRGSSGEALYCKGWGVEGIRMPKSLGTLPLQYISIRRTNLISKGFILWARAFRFFDWPMYTR